MLGFDRNRNDVSADYGDLVVRAAIGAVLVAAGLAKIFLAADEAVGGSTVLDSWPAQLLAAEFEIALGGWLWIVGFRPAWVRAVAVGCFSLFALIAAYKAVAGYASCGCFGAVAVSPLYTLAADACALFALAARSSRRQRWSQWHGRLLAARCLSALAAFALIALPALRSTAGLNDAREIVVVEPELWVDKPLPLLPYIDVANTINRGNWWLIFHRHGCDRCRALLDYCARRPDRASKRMAGSSPRIALVELPPYGEPVSVPSSFVVGRLSDSAVWAMKTPLIVVMQDGFVVSVPDLPHSLAGYPPRTVSTKFAAICSAKDPNA